MTTIKPNITSGHVLHVGDLVLSVGGVFSMSRASAVFVFLCCIRVFGAFGACGAESAAANAELRRSAPSALRLDGDFFEFGLLYFRPLFLSKPDFLQVFSHLPTYAAKIDKF